jgi:hypothetical protein
MPTPQPQTDHPPDRADAPDADPLRALLMHLTAVDDEIVAAWAAGLLRDGGEEGRQKRVRKKSRTPDQRSAAQN